MTPRRTNQTSQTSQGGISGIIRKWRLPILTIVLLAAAIGTNMFSGVTAGGLAGGSLFTKSTSADIAIDLPAPLDSLASVSSVDTAIFAGGCFWGIEAVFEHVRGVENVVSGYSGGDSADARYHLVSRGRTQHAEAVRIIYDPSVVSYGTLLQVFFSVAHDPTQLNRQGPDVGKHYRSSIFYSSESQKQTAAEYIRTMTSERVYSKPIVTQLTPLDRFYPAEPYHQDYARKNPRNLYIVTHDLPKVAALEKKFPKLYKSEAAD